MSSEKQPTVVIPPDEIPDEAQIPLSLQLPIGSDKSLIEMKQLAAQKSKRNSHWDPLADSSSGVPTATATARVKRDLMQLYIEPPPGLYVVADETNMMTIHAIIFGVMDTPYEGGFFYFVIKCPSNFPINPPKVRLMTTDAGRVRFNPNMYSCGKVCMSILGTWAGPPWSPALQLSSVLLSIQSLMNDKPYFNEPGFKKQVPGEVVEAYNEMIRHETLRVAVCGMLENECNLTIPKNLREIMEKSFLQYYEEYVFIATNNLHRDNMQMNDPYRMSASRKFNYAAILERLKAIKTKLTEKYGDVADIQVEPAVSISSVTG